MEKLKEAFHIALTNLAHNAVRSMLSILGVVIGISAVITILSIGAGTKKQIMEQIESMGANVYTIGARYDQTTQRMGELSLEDVQRLSRTPGVATVTPQLNLYRVFRSRSKEMRGMVVGVDDRYLSVKGFKLVFGRNFSPLEIEGRAVVCLVGEQVAQDMFGGVGAAVGQNLYMDNVPWQVIGVYSSDKKFGADTQVCAPLPTLLRSMKDISIASLDVQVKPDSTAGMKEELLSVMERDDPNRKGLFSLRDPKDYFARSMEFQNNLFFIGVLVAGVSLVVGGIGMMNVMLTSVAERTREIGIRRAVGARKKDILFQFLVESCVLSLIGGILGLLLGAALARGLPVLFKEFFTVMPLIRPMFLVFALSVGVTLGIAFGFYPAVKASQLSPSEALRTE